MKFSKLYKNGFTLPELLATIVIIGILSSIAVVSVTKILGSAHNKYYEKQRQLLTSAVQNYFTDNKKKLPVETYDSKKITLADLIKENYINKIVDHKGKACDITKSYGIVTKESIKKYTYDAVLVCDNGQSGNVNDTTNKVNTTRTPIIFTEPSFSKYNAIVNGVQTISGQKLNGIYYINNKVDIDIYIRDDIGISGYRYILHKNNKIYYKSELLSAKTQGTTAMNDTLTINKDTCSDGEYTLSAIEYDINGKASTEVYYTNSTERIKFIVDTKKPTCSITLPNKTKENYVNNWYNAKVGDTSIIFSDLYLNKYDVTTSEKPEYNLTATGTTITKTIYLPNTTNQGQAFYGYVTDKAGNVGSCKTEAIRVDKSVPTCETIDKNGGVVGDGDWYKK